MKWILIVLWSVSGSQTGVAMHEFDSVDACQWASQQIHKRASEFPPRMVCVPKGIKGGA